MNQVVSASKRKALCRKLVGHAVRPPMGRNRPVNPGTLGLLGASQHMLLGLGDLADRYVAGPMKRGNRVDAALGDRVQPREPADS